MRLLLWLIFCCCVLSREGAAQQYLVTARRYGPVEGLPHRQVNHLIQDRQGFIWTATNGGVARFDGHRFEVYNASESGLSGDIVDWVAEDAAGNIWACRYGANGWINVIDPRSGRVIRLDRYLGKFPLPVAPDILFQPPVLLPEGVFLFVLPAYAGWMRYDPGKGWTSFQIPGSRHFYLTHFTEKGTLWGLSTEDGPHRNVLVEMTQDGRILQRIYPQPGYFFIPKKGQTDHRDGFFIQEIKEAQDPVLWELDASGKRRIADCRMQQPLVRQHAHLEGRRIEVQFPRILDADGNLLIDISRQFPEIDIFQYRDYLLDRTGNIWFATTFGIIVVEYRETHFRRILYRENAAGDRGLACRGLLEQNGRLFVNTETFEQGRFLVDLNSDKMERISEGATAIGIGESADGNVWTEDQKPGAPWGSAFLLKTDSAGRPLGALRSFMRSNGYIWSIFEENPRRVLLGHADGVTVYDPVAGTVQPWSDPRAPAFDNAGVSCILRSRSGQIWACTNKGLFRLHPGGRVAEHLWTGGRGDAYLPYDNIYHLYEDASGVFWLGTGGGGLIRLDRRAAKREKIQVIFRKNGLLNGVVYTVYEDAREHLWLPTDYGIVQLDKKSLQVRHTWLKADGVTHNEFNRVSHCRGADGTLYFGGLNGVTAFHPDDFYNSPDSAKQAPPLVVSGFSVLDAGSGRLKNHTGDLLRSGRIVIRPDDHYVELEFALLDYMAPEKATYTWKLEGVSAEWESLKEPVLRLSGLPWGTHRLRIRAQAADGAWAANELIFQLDMLPPFYLRTWFMVLAAVLLAAGVRVWVFWRLRAHRRAQARLESEVSRQTATIRAQSEDIRQLDRAKSRFFANVSHELRTPLTLILGPLASILKGKQLRGHEAALAETAYQHSLQLLRLVNEILDLSKLEAGKMSVYEKPFAPHVWLRRMVGDFEIHAQNLGIRFELNNRVPEDVWVMADVEKWRTICSNLLSNALKFTPPNAGGSVVIEAEVRDNLLCLAVHDTGRGIHPDDLPHIFERFFQSGRPGAPTEGGVGIGLALCRDLTELMGGRIRAESEPGRGSSFYVEFPLKKIQPAGETMKESMDVWPSPTPLHANTPPALARPHILLVEDNEGMRDFLNWILSADYQVAHARHGGEALQYLENAQALPDLILSDLMMPVMDGLQLLEVLKNDHRWRAVPVVMLTARADLRDKLQALRIGVDDYLLKPFEADELLVRLENLLARARARRSTGKDAAQAGQVSPSVSGTDQEWLQRLEVLTVGAVGDSRLSADWLAAAMLVGRSVFYKKVKQLTGLTPNEYIQEVRMEKARLLLETGAHTTVKEVARAVGAKDVKYFSEQFRKRYGKRPSAYQ